MTTGISRRTFLGSLALALGGCVTLGPERAGPPVAAPAYRVGDRWVYRARDGFRLPVVWDETHEVIASGPSGIRVRVTQRGPNIDNVREEVLDAPGVLRVGAVFDAETRRFPAEPLRRFDFPLVTGKVWSQRVPNEHDTPVRTGRIERWVRVGGWGSIATPAGTFDAVGLRVFTRLDDEEFWRYATECNDLLWYAPAVRNVVRDEREAEYAEKGDDSTLGRIRSQHALVELVSFAPGA